MRKRNENDELLINSSKINRKAGLKAGLETTIMLIIGLICTIPIWLNCILERDREMIKYLLIILLICWGYFLWSKKTYKEQEELLLKIALLDKCMSFQEYTEVKPFNMDKFKKKMIKLSNSYIKMLPLQNTEEEYKQYIEELLEDVKFYAHSSSKNKKNSIEIFVKYEKEGKFRYYKSVTKEDFLDEYAIQEEIE